MTLATIGQQTLSEFCDVQGQRVNGSAPLHAHLINHAPVGMVVWHLADLDDLQTFKLVELNPLAQEILQRSPHHPHTAIASDPFPAFFKMESPQVYAEVIRSAIPNDLGEICYRELGQIERTYAIKLFPLPDQCLGALIEDVSRRRTTEDALRRSEQKLLFHMQQTSMAVIEWDLQGHIVEWNPAAERIFGYSKREAIGFKADLILPDESYEKTTQLHQALLARKGSIHRISENITKTGKRIICEWHNTSLIDEDQHIVGIASLAQDITKRQRIEDAIAASEARYRQLFETSQDGIMILNGKTGQITDANPYLLSLLNYSLSELIDKPFWELGFSEDKTENLINFQSLLQQGYIRYDHLPLRAKDGQKIDVEFISNLYETDGSTIIQCNIRDITERKRIEAELKQFTQRLEQSNRELQDFASIASHDLQEPLRKIQAFGDRLQLKCGSALSDEGKDYLERMQKAALRMQTLINDLLAFSRITTKAQPFVSVNLNTVVAGVLSDLEIHIQQVGAVIQVDPLPTLDADPLQMRQLLQNLISNALKFHKPGEAPHIQIRQQQQACALGSSIASQHSGICCQISVCDNGIGFERKYLDRIFTVFQRLHSRSEYDGTGIGLAICRKIVERHNGSITAESAPGEGATFIVTLPIQQVNSYTVQGNTTEANNGLLSSQE